MRVLVTGSRGYVGSVLVPMLQASGHQVIGLDTDWFAGCDFGEAPGPDDWLCKDLREVTVSDLGGLDAICHLAALSNDPLGDLDPTRTHSINHAASVALARHAKAASISRFVFSSSCSLYGASETGDALDETAAFHPVTPYGETKIWVERDLRLLANPTFCPVYLRNATAYGASPRLRLDIVVNNLVGWAHTTGEVKLLSDGTPWRPLVHVEDIARAFCAALTAPRDAVWNEAFNVGRTDENYQIRELAEIVERVVPGSRVTLGANASPDLRDYRVNCDKIADHLPAFEPRWRVPEGAAQLYRAYREHGLDHETFKGSRYLRLKRIEELQSGGRLDGDLRWI